tara:strand:- start:3577 stop:3966 length:390 start_codon:yes stop_codon:yes gene_type:complete
MNKNKDAIGKVYEKYQMAKELTDLLTVGSAMNKETGRREVVLCIKQGDQTIPLGNLWSAKDFALRDYDVVDSIIFDRVFAHYSKNDNRTSLDEFNNGYHPKDKNYSQLWDYIDRARAGAQEVLEEEGLT